MDDDSREEDFFPEEADSPGSYSLACGGVRLGRPVGPTCTVAAAVACSAVVLLLLLFLLGRGEAMEFSDGDALMMVSADRSEHPLCSFST